MFEMGSEFSEGATKVGINKYKNLVEMEKRYVLSGRTAIAHIIEDIMSYSLFRKVALPGYCCSSMIKPFYTKGIDVIFYEFYSKYEEIIDQAEVVLVMDYFGFESSLTVKIAEIVKKKGKILIVDGTQTAFSRLKTYDLADYILVSYRKWTDCLCAAVYSRRGFSIDALKKNNSDYVLPWRKAADMKKEYLECNRGNKTDFLQLYRKANELLDAEYDGYAAPPSEIEKFESVDSDDIRMRRRKNALFLIENLKPMLHLKRCNLGLMYERLSDEDCPLFIPMLVDAVKRDEIRKQLISRGIYCPIHWPIDQRYPYVRTQYHNSEISLICDQRYENRDISQEIEEVSKAVFSF